ncbi:hypothetical protein M9H77_04180 [Catharanthus roseus]|uniref:Uncharacterized protein n=1 Tax=Catharanthus roseus TaxID=4058 RepID=A0ACC0CDK3_CATRO|nr:hypothetical protein M9H77_04180 [Catharanthus roseus]
MITGFIIPRNSTGIAAAAPLLRSLVARKKGFFRRNLQEISDFPENKRFTTWNFGVDAGISIISVNLKLVVIRRSSEEEESSTFDEVSSASEDESEDQEEENTDQDEDREEAEEDRSKRQKITLRTDLISALPDWLLHHILSFLDLEKAASTSLLSRRWRFLWTSMSDFNISFKEHIPRDTFISVIHRILLQCKPPGSLINKLAVEFPNHYHVSVAPDVGAWIQFATQRKVRDLRLRLIGEYLCLDHIYHLPRHIYGNSELRNLSLSCVQVLPDSMEFSGIYKLNIHAMNLKKLVIENCRRCRRGTMEISAPNIQTLNLLGSNCRSMIVKLVNVSSLVSACIDIMHTPSSNEYYSLHNLLLSLDHVKELEIGSDCLQAAFRRSGTDPSYHFSLSQRVLRLNLYTPVGVEIMHPLTKLLQSSTRLQSLFINIKTTNPDQKKRLSKVEGHDSTGQVVNCALLHLKNVKIAGFIDCHDSQNSILELAKYLLKSSPVLEKMVIHGGNRSTLQTNCSCCHASPAFVKVAQQLLSFPRTSRNAVIIFSK